MNNIILCHIAGLNNFTKQEFILNIMKYHDLIEVIDFDMITKIIYKSEKFKNYEKKKQHQLMVKYWEKEFDDIFRHNLLESKNNFKKVICIGSNVYARSRFVNVNVDTDNKIFLNTKNSEHVKQIITHNIKSYSHEIVNGTFPLKFIQHDFLSSQRKILENVHKQLKYDFYSMTNIVKQIEKIIPENENEPPTRLLSNNNETNDLYFTSSVKYNTRFINNINSDMLSLFSDTPNIFVAYKQKWMALLCSVLNDGTKMTQELINITTNKNKIIVQEIKSDSLKKLQQHIYLYKVSSEGFKNDVNNSPYKYKNTSAVEILETTFIQNIENELREINGVELKSIKMI